jgi:hypothetical protein
MPCQIVVLHVQNKPAASMAALQATHGWRHDFSTFFRSFRRGLLRAAAFRWSGGAFCACTVARR